MRITTLKGRKINKIISLGTLIPALVFELLGIILLLLGYYALGETLLITGLILAGFSALYGSFWFVYWKKEKKAERIIQQMMNIIELKNVDERIQAYEFQLPREELLKAAKERFRRMCSGFSIAACVVFFLLVAVLFFCGGTFSILQLFYFAIFSLLVTVPGLLIQWNIYHKYEKLVPGHILLYPGAIYIDRKAYQTETIKSIQVSSADRFNYHSVELYRKLKLLTTSGKSEYMIDYRCEVEGESIPRWASYKEFIQSLTRWGKENKIPIDVKYMD